MQAKQNEEEKVEFTKRPICFINRKKFCQHLGQIGDDPACMAMLDRPNAGRKLHSLRGDAPADCPKRTERGDSNENS